MPIPLGVLAVAGAGAPVVAGNAYEWLETASVTSGTQATITFSNLNATYGSTYQHLQIRWTGRTDRSGTFNDPLRYTFNADSGANYADHRIYGTGSTQLVEVSSSSTTATMHNGLAAATASTSIFTSGVVDILDPFETTKNTTVRALYSGMNSTSVYQIALHSGLWNNTAALTTITFDPIGNFIAGTRFSLYGLRSA